MSTSTRKVTDRISLASYLANRLYESEILKDNAANLVFDRLHAAFEELSDEQLADVYSDVAAYIEYQAVWSQVPREGDK